ncbi:unnamed protein product [Caenorhabditis brenneri]
MEVFNSINDYFEDRVVLERGHLIMKRKNSTKEVHISYRKDFKYMYLGRIESFCVFKIEIVESQETKKQ